MEMTMEEYIRNPMGKKNAVYSNREMYRGFYKEKFNKILLRENGTIHYELFKDDDESHYYAYFKIPSEVVEDFYYDVVIEFTQPKGVKSLGTSLKNYNVRFYANDPSFVYTFAYAFSKNEMFIKEYADKMSKKALTTKAVEKNPKESVGYVKSIYFAYLFMENRGLFLKTKYLKRYSYKYVLGILVPADIKIAERQEMGTAAAKKERQDRKALEEKIRRDKELDPLGIRHRVNKINMTKQVNKAKSAFKSNVTKKTKRTGKR